jgi:hypothetical protein
MASENQLTWHDEGRLTAPYDPGRLLEASSELRVADIERCEVGLPQKVIPPLFPFVGRCLLVGG